MAGITSAIIGGVGLVSSIVGQRKAGKAAKRATDAQTLAGERAIQSQEAAQAEARGLAQPFVDFGGGLIDPLQQSLQPVSQEQEFEQLQQNPLFKAALSEGRRNIGGSLSTFGRLGSGDESKALSDNFLLSASPLLGQQRQQRQQNINNLFSGVAVGQSAAAGQAVNTLNTGVNVGNLQTQIGNVQGAGIVAGQNVRQQGNQDIVSQLPSVVKSIGGLFSPPPTDPFFNRQAGFGNIGDPFSSRLAA